MLVRRRNRSSLHCGIEQEDQALVTTDGNEFLPLVVTEWSARQARIVLEESIGGDTGCHVSDFHGDPAWQARRSPHHARPTPLGC